MLFWTLIHTLSARLLNTNIIAAGERSITRRSVRQKEQASAVPVCPEWEKLEGVNGFRPGASRQNSGPEVIKNSTTLSSWQLIGMDSYF